MMEYFIYGYLAVMVLLFIFMSRAQKRSNERMQHFLTSLQEVEMEFSAMRDAFVYVEQLKDLIERGEGRGEQAMWVRDKLDEYYHDPRIKTEEGRDLLRGVAEALENLEKKTLELTQ